MLRVGQAKAAIETLTGQTPHAAQVFKVGSAEKAGFAKSAFDTREHVAKGPIGCKVLPRLWCVLVEQIGLPPRGPGKARIQVTHSKLAFPIAKTLGRFHRGEGSIAHIRICAKCPNFFNSPTQHHSPAKCFAAVRRKPIALSSP